MVGKRKVEVDVVVGKKHTMDIPKGTGLLVAKYLRKFVPPDCYKAYLGRQIRGGNYKQGEVKPLRPEKGALTLAAQPGNNGTRHEIHVILGGALDTYDVFKRMKGARENGTIQLESQKRLSGVETPAKQIELDSPMKELKCSGDKKEGDEMEDQKQDQVGDKIRRKRLNFMKLLSDQEVLHVNLLSLSEVQERAGYLNASNCESLFVQNSLMGSDHTPKAIYRLFTVLHKMGYVDSIKGRGHYAISDKCRELLKTQVLAPSPTSMPSSVDGGQVAEPGVSEIEKKLQSRIDCLKDLAEAEKVLEAATTSVQEVEAQLIARQESQRQAEEKVKEIKAKIMADLNL